MPAPLSPDLLQKMHAYWRAANYLSVGQIYLRDNPLLEEPLTLEHIKPRLLGHWGTTTGLNFLYVHLNRLIKENDLNMIYVIGPGHGGPGLVAQSLSRRLVHRALSGDRAQPQRAAPAVSPVLLALWHSEPCLAGNAGLDPRGRRAGLFPGARLWRGFRQSRSDRRLRRRRRRGRDRPLAASWHSNKFLNPARDGAVLPILHLNGFKIANPTVLARISREELTELLRGYGYEPHFVEGDEPMAVHQDLARRARCGARAHPRDPGRRPRRRRRPNPSGRAGR